METAQNKHIRGEPRYSIAPPHSAQDPGLDLAPLMSTIYNHETMLEITRVAESNRKVFYELSQAYETEFSPITHKNPDESGVYAFTDQKPGYEAWLAYRDKQPVGFAVICTKLARIDVAEFYIIPSARRDRLGEELAVWAFDHYPGEWQVRQIMGAEYARDFWVAIIKKYSAGQFTNSKIRDPEWGEVYIQTFTSKKVN